MPRTRYCIVPSHVKAWNMSGYETVLTMLQPQPSGMRFHHSSTHHPLVVDSLELGRNPSLHTGLRAPLRTFVEECMILHLHYILASWSWEVETVLLVLVLCLETRQLNCWLIHVCDSSLARYISQMTVLVLLLLLSAPVSVLILAVLSWPHHWLCQMLRHVLHVESKNVSILLCSTSPNIDIFSKFFYQ